MTLLSFSMLWSIPYPRPVIQGHESFPFLFRHIPGVQPEKLKHSKLKLFVQCFNKSGGQAGMRTRALHPCGSCLKEEEIRLVKGDLLYLRLLTGIKYIPFLSWQNFISAFIVFLWGSVSQAHNHLLCCNSGISILLTFNGVPIISRPVGSSYSWTRESPLSRLEHCFLSWLIQIFSPMTNTVLHHLLLSRYWKTVHHPHVLFTPLLLKFRTGLFHDTLQNVCFIIPLLCQPPTFPDASAWQLSSDHTF